MEQELKTRMTTRLTVQILYQDVRKSMKDTRSYLPAQFVGIRLNRKAHLNADIGSQLLLEVTAVMCLSLTAGMIPNQ